MTAIAEKKRISDFSRQGSSAFGHKVGNFIAGKRERNKHEKIKENKVPAENLRRMECEKISQANRGGVYERFCSHGKTGKTDEIKNFLSFCQAEF